MFAFDSLDPLLLVQGFGDVVSFSISEMEISICEMKLHGVSVPRVLKTYPSTTQCQSFSLLCRVLFPYLFHVRIQNSEAVCPEAHLAISRVERVSIWVGDGHRTQGALTWAGSAVASGTFQCLLYHKRKCYCILTQLCLFLLSISRFRSGCVYKQSCQNFLYGTEKQTRS